MSTSVGKDIDQISIRGRKVADLNLALKEAWTEMGTHGSILAQTLAEIGISVEKLPKSPSDLIQVKKLQAPVTPGAFELIIAVAGTAAAQRIGRDIWEKVLLPWLRRKWGDKAVEHSTLEKKSAKAKFKRLED